MVKHVAFLALVVVSGCLGRVGPLPEDGPFGYCVDTRHFIPAGVDPGKGVIAWGECAFTREDAEGSCADGSRCCRDGVFLACDSDGAVGQCEVEEVDEPGASGTVAVPFDRMTCEECRDIAEIGGHTFNGDGAC